MTHDELPITRLNLSDALKTRLHEADVKTIGALRHHLLDGSLISLVRKCGPEMERQFRNAIDAFDKQQAALDKNSVKIEPSISIVNTNNVTGTSTFNRENAKQTKPVWRSILTDFKVIIGIVVGLISLASYFTGCVPEMRSVFSASELIPSIIEPEMVDGCRPSTRVTEPMEYKLIKGQTLIIRYSHGFFPASMHETIEIEIAPKDRGIVSCENGIQDASQLVGGMKVVGAGRYIAQVDAIGEGDATVVLKVDKDEYRFHVHVDSFIKPADVEGI